MATDYVLSVRDARKRFGAVTALDGASVDLRPRELLALLGPNGAGKTTLIRAIAGRVRLDSGEVRFSDGAGGTARMLLGIVPQEIAVYPLLTARENLEAFGRLHGVADAALRDRIDWALEMTALADRADALARTFSGGMKRRLNIACGVLHMPRVVLLDEPTAGVDPQSRDRIYEMLEMLRGEGASLLVTTHHLEEAEARCERIVIIDRGRVIAGGTLPQLVEQTVGSDRLVTIHLDAPLRTPVDGFAPAAGNTGATTGAVLAGQVRDVAADLADVLRRVAAAGGIVQDVEVRRPSLQSVFIHLTGRELRE
jgi:ABC-2 type transport system ATP-binding protein